MRIDTRSLVTDRNPSLTAALTSSPDSSPLASGWMRTRLPGDRMPNTGARPLRMPMSPSIVFAMTMPAWPDQSERSGISSST